MRMSWVMISLDTNILVRFFTRDDPVQSPLARDILAQRCSEDSPGLVTSIVLAELFWTLRRAYRYERAQMVKIIEVMLQAKELCFEHPDEVRYALELYREGGVDFSDALIGAISRRLGSQTTLTFDAGAARLPEFTLAGQVGE